MSEERLAGIEARLDQMSDLVNALRDRGKAFILPSFSGENSRAFVSWLYGVECYFENECFSEKRKLELVVSCLKGDALLWYDNHTFSRRMEGKGRIRSWSKLEMKMRLKYLPCSTMDELWAELKTLKQNSLSVIEYAKLFEELHFVCDPEVSSSLSRIRFYLGLKSEIARRINLKMIHSFGELFELALCVERSLARLRKQEVLAETESLEIIKTVGKEEGLNQKVVVSSMEIVCPNPKPETTEQTSLKMVFPIDEMNQPVSGENLESKPEIVDQTELEMTCSPTEVSHVSDACIVRCLNPMENESLIVDHEEDEESVVLTPSKPFKLTKTDLALAHYENKDQIHNLSPNETISNHLLFECQTQKNNQPTSHFTTEIYESLVKPYPTFETCVVRGKSPDLSTPHFHFYMLVRLQDSLVHLSTNPYILERKKGEVAQFQSCCPILKLLSYEEFQSLNYHWCVLFEVEKGLATSEMLVPRIAKWNLFQNGSLNSTTFYCSDLKDMFVCGHDSGACDVSFASVTTCPLSLKKGNAAFPREFSCISEIASWNERGGISEKEPLQYLGLLAMRLNKSCVNSCSGAEIMLPVVAWEAMEKLEGGGTHSDIKPAHSKRPRHFFLIFDPGGGDMKSVHEVITAPSKCEKIFFSYNQNLRSNSFEPGEVDAGARARGLSFSMPIEQSMKQLQRHAKTEKDLTLHS